MSAPGRPSARESGDALANPAAGAPSRASARATRRRRLVDGDDDILDGVANFFDLGLIFGLGFMLALMASAGAAASGTAQPAATEDGRAAAAPDADAAVPRDSQPLPRYRLGRSRAAGDGVKLGTAYRLPSGDVVCVPEGEPPR